MTPTDIDALARLLDGDPTLNGEATAETRLLGLVAYHLGNAPAQQAAPEFKAQLRATLVEEARVLAAPAGPSRVRAGFQGVVERWRRSVRVVAGTASAILLLSTGGMAVAADRALPSDALYTTKLVLEDVRIALVRDGVGRGEAHLDQASSRIGEAEAVAPAGDSAGAARALVAADEAARAGAGELLRAYQEERDDRAVERLLAFTDAEQLRLAELTTVLTGEAVDAAEALAIGLERIESRLTAVMGTCPGCSGGVPASGAGFDFTAIPSAREAFEACPCETATPGDEPPPADAAAEPPPAPQPPPADEPPLPPPDQPDRPAVEQPVPVPPGVEPPPPPPTQPPSVLELPDLREPLLGPTDTILEEVIENVLGILQ